ncbi:hypothetical protein FSP39_007994 [Pinctada imbricata]|uniref:WSC domain-containing protein n=1 Tax=Pinctada imbricata TaxID=66713 RepID=A0AA89C8S5_PINIB|nr:hypothetical protein FSP39_007994 [Pinctada imbricata]
MEQYGKECFCGDLMKNYPLRPDSECDMACSGNRNQKCGGSWRISVYRTNNIEKDLYVGCFVDKYSRILPDMTIYQKNSIALCLATCKEKNATYAGVEYGKECFCGNLMKNYPLRPDSECDMACSGNRYQKCGGSWRISVYRTDTVEIGTIEKDKIPTPKKVAKHFGRQFVRPDPQYPRDIIVIIDSSGSIGKQLFDRALPDLAELVGYFCPEPDPFVPQNNSFYHRLGVIQFSTVTEDIFNLDRYNNLGAIKGAIRSIKYMKKKTCTDKAFDAAYRMITQDGGARLPAVAKKQVLILTDGMWNCDGDPVAASKRLQTVADVYGFMIGINSKVKRRKLEKVISEPLLNHLFAVKNFSKFNVVVRQLGKTIKRGPLQCKEFQKP